MTNAVSRFLGGSPAMVAVRLIVVSFVVGVVLETFGLDPATLFADALGAVRQIVELGLRSLRAVRERRDLDSNVSPVEPNQSRLAHECVSHDVERLDAKRRELEEDLPLEAR